MGLKYSFRHLFYGKLFHKDRLYKLLEDLDERLSAVEGGEGSSSYDDTDIKADISDLKSRVQALENPQSSDAQSSDAPANP